MAANDSFLTATEVTFNPLTRRYRVSQDPESLTTDLFWTFETPDDCYAVSVLAWSGDRDTPDPRYRPRVEFYNGTAENPTQTTPGGSFTYTGSLPVIVGTFPGQRIWVKIDPTLGDDPGGVMLELLMEYANAPSLSQGAYVVNDDTQGFPAAIVDSETGAVTGFVPAEIVPAGEFGDSVPAGYIAIDDVNESEMRIVRLDRTAEVPFVSFVVPSLTTGDRTIRASYDGGQFYTFDTGNVVYAIESSSGATNDTWDLGGGGDPISLSPDENDEVLYYIRSGSQTILRRHDLVNDVPLSNFTTISGYNFSPTDAIFPLDEGRILTVQLSTGAAADQIVVYNADATVHRTITLADNLTNRVGVGRRRVGTTLGRHWMAVWRYSADQDVFTLYDIDSGNILRVAQAWQFSGGGMDSGAPIIHPDSLDPPPQMFGHATSCPMVMMPEPPLEDDSHDCCECPCPPPGPTGPGNTGDPGPPPSSPGDIFDPVDPESWVRFCVGGGDVPFQADPTDSESWVS